MGRSRTSISTHVWTNFELHTLLCLMAKGMHIEGRGLKRTDDPSKLKQHAYLDVATSLNDAVHKSDYENDINRKEVAKMIDQLLVERKGVVGKGGYLERQKGGRITRGLRRAFERKLPIDFDGSVSEWKMWRKEKEIERDRVRRGLPPQESIKESGEGSPAVQNPSGVTDDEVWRAATSTASSAALKVRSSNHSRWVGDSHQNMTSAAQEQDLNQGRAPVAQSMSRGHDSFENLPANLRYSGKYSWRAPETNKPADKSIDSCRPTQSSGTDQSRGTVRDSYRPTTHGPLSRSIMSSSIPDITHVHDSSPTKGVSSHVNNPAAAFASTSSITPFDLNSQIDDLLVTSLHTEITNNNDKSDVFMIPSIPSLFKERLVEQGINAERQAMLVSESGDVEMDMRIYGEGGEGGDGGGRNSGANKDPLPFNRLDWEEAFVGGRAESKKDVGMADGEDKQIVEGFFGGLL